jgi:hypothetical protein
MNQVWFEFHWMQGNIALVLGNFFFQQDNYIEEAFKMRNVLEEFESRKYGKSKPTILGLREHIFTGRLVCLSKEARSVMS